LGKIEEHNTKVSVDFRNPKITIEHIMPQKLEVAWIKDLGENHNGIHKQYLHNIGNLILTEFNSEIGNKPFSDKKKKLYSSSLNYRLSVISKDIWNEESILLHRENMVSWFLETFALPEIHQETLNWNANTIEKTRFSPLDFGAGDIAEGNKPIEISIENKKINVSTWQDVFLKFIHFIYDNQNYDFNILIENQNELFVKNDVIVNLEQLFLLIDNNSEFSTRYKTFGGKVWDKVDEMRDDELFIHINISASTCMSRVAKIMNKFNMEENSVEIVLK
jgi:hypothetical protein